jgi:N-acetylneuraminic acid mutarotase
MSRKRGTVLCLGLSAALAACDGDSNTDITSPRLSEAETAELQSLGDSWAKKRSVSPYRIRMAAGAINGVIYVAGGIAINWATLEAHDLARVDAYDVATNTWARVAPMPAAREFPNGASAINGKLYVTGGINPDNKMTRTLFVYDPKTNSWTRKADMPQLGCAGIQGVMDGKLYVYTYLCRRNSSSDDPMARLYRYDPATDTWVKRALPPQLLSSSGGVISGKFYLAAAYVGTRPPTPLYAYDPMSNSWQKKAPMSQPFHDMAGAVVNGKLFMVGGSDGFSGEDPGPELEMYDPVSNSWASRTPLPFGVAEGAAVGAAGKVYYIVGRAYPVTGGERTLSASELYAYTP